MHRDRFKAEADRLRSHNTALQEGLTALQSTSKPPEKFIGIGKMNNIGDLRQKHGDLSPTEIKSGLQREEEKTSRPWYQLSPPTKSPAQEPTAATDTTDAREAALRRVFHLFDWDDSKVVESSELFALGTARRQQGHMPGVWTSEMNAQLIQATSLTQSSV